MKRIPFVLLAVAAASTVALGYGGVGVKLSFADVEPLNRRLQQLAERSRWGGDHTFDYRAPLVWLGGHGAGRSGGLTFGGSGYATAWSSAADSLAAELFGVSGWIEAGYRIEPNRFFWIRPYVDVGGFSWVHYLHTRESFSDPKYEQFYFGWTVGAEPGLELMGRIPHGAMGYIGPFVTVGYFVPILDSQWSGDASPPDFGWQGLSFGLGVRFGRMPGPSIRI